MNRVIHIKDRDKSTPTRWVPLCGSIEEGKPLFYFSASQSLYNNLMCEDCRNHPDLGMLLLAEQC